FLHVKREWNQSADQLASAALQREEGEIVTSADDRQDLITLNRLGEMLKPKLIETVVSVNAITRAAERQRRTPKAMDEAIIQRIRCQRIRQAQDEEKWIADLKKYLDGQVNVLTAEEAKICSKMAAYYEVDDNGLLFFCPKTLQRGEDRDGVVRMVIPDSLQRDFLHHYRASLEGGHHSVGRTYRRIQANFHWRGLYRSVQRYVGECTDCETGKGKPTGQGESLITRKHPGKHRTADLGRLVHRLRNSQGWSVERGAGEECVFRRFGASEVIRHDREPGFMSDFFRAFNRIVKLRQSATMAYRPQGNGNAERMTFALNTAHDQTLTRDPKMYVADVNQKDWDDYAERLTFALNTAHDRVRGETSFFLVHGWDPRSTLEAVVSVGSTRRRDCDARRWRYHIQGQYRRAREAVKSRADQHNDNVRPHRIEEGTQVWLYLYRVKEGYTRKLAHVAWTVPRHRADRQSRSSSRDCRIRVSNLPDSTSVEAEASANVPRSAKDDDRVHFDEELLPDDSWDTPLDEDEFEVEWIADVRSGRRTRYGRGHHTRKG
ncbi:reverse transcriptase, partial [Phytophthora megakarya]